MITDRLVFKSLFSAFLLGFFTLSACSTTDDDASTDPITVVSYGGYWQEVLKTSMYDPFVDQSGIGLIEQTYDGSYQPLLDESLFQTNKWDLVNVETNMVQQGEDDDIVEPIDYSVVNVDDFIPEAVHSHGVGVMTWSWILAYNKDLFGQSPPQSWVDFFDIDRYPGSRGLQDDPRRTLEMALMADGVPPNQLYPLDVERALTKLTELNDDLIDNNMQLVWWNAYARPAELLDNGIVVMSPGTNGRILQSMRAGITKIDYIWDGGIIDLDWWVVMKDSPNKETAMEFLKYASSVEAQREMSLMISYGPVNNAALASLPEEVRRTLPTYPANLAKQFYFDTVWWTDNYNTVIERWNQWRETL